MRILPAAMSILVARWPRHLGPTLVPTIPIAVSGTVADVLVDTDIFIDHLRGAKELWAGNHRLNYSVITRAELFAGSSATDAVTQLLAPLHEHPVDRAVAERAGRIKRETGIRMPDALIAATALESKLSLVTRNRRDFGKVRGLRLRQLG
jgi:predicted nucleic acid-binding protein